MSDYAEWNPCCPECSIRDAKKDAEIERLRAALRAIAGCDVRDDMDVAMEIAREALGDE